MKTLAIGAVSKEAIEATFKVSHVLHKPFLLEVDQKQCDYDSGYVMTTQELVRYCKNLKQEYYDAQVYLLRKDCGQSIAKESWKTLEADCKNNFDIIHLNFSGLKINRSEAHTKCAQAIRFAKKLNPTVRFNIGHNHLKGRELIEEINFFSEYGPLYCTVDTGANVREDMQLGKFIPERVINDFNDLNSSRLFLKEDHSDFINAQEVYDRKNLTHCLSIGTELAVAENSYYLNQFRIHNHSLEKLTKDAMANKAWKKLLHTTNPDDETLCLALTSHWYYNTPEGKRLISKVDSTPIVPALCDIINRYATNYF